MPASGCMCGQQRTTCKRHPLFPSWEHLTQVSGLIAAHLYPLSCPLVMNIQILVETGLGANKLSKFCDLHFQDLGHQKFLLMNTKLREAEI